MRWMVVDKNRTPVVTGLIVKENAQMTADALNDLESEGHRVVPDLVAEDLDD